MSHFLGPSDPGTVVLDIGDRTGALVLEAGPEDLGLEIEVSPVTGGPRTHAAIRERRLGAGNVYCAVYPALTAGDYTVWRLDSSPAGTVTIEGGRVSVAML